MNLNDWLGDGSVRRQPPRTTDIAALLANVDQDLRDAALPGLSADRAFSTACEAALGLATMVLRATGYRVSSSGAGHHAKTLALLPKVMGSDQMRRAGYLDQCRKARNRATYEGIGVVTEREARSLLAEVLRFRNDVLAWLQEHHPELL